MNPQAKTVTGLALLIVGIFLFGGIIEIVAAASGAYLLATGIREMRS